MSDLNKVMLIGKVTKLHGGASGIDGVTVETGHGLGKLSQLCKTGTLRSAPFVLGASIYIEGRLLQNGTVQITDAHQLTA